MNQAALKVSAPLELIPKHHACALLVNLSAIEDNYDFLSKEISPAKCLPVVKADAYSLGAKEIVETLIAKGADTFCVATPEEGAKLREHFSQITLLILNGLYQGAESYFHEHRLTPVLNSLQEVISWHAYTNAQNSFLPAAIHVDTGMTRQGLSVEELEIAAQKLKEMEISIFMSHLACSGEKDHLYNNAQLNKFEILREKYFPNTPAALSNSGGVFLGSAFHFDYVRIGKALYGFNPMTEEIAHALTPAVSLIARVNQIHTIPEGQSVGYNATSTVTRPSRIATLGIGYADGLMRSVGAKGYVQVGAYKVPFIGPISMDLCSIDITDIPIQELHVGSWVSILNESITPELHASWRKTIGHEIITQLGKRVHRVYYRG